MKPSKLNFVRLGTRTRPFKALKVGNKASLLNHAVRSSLPVPNGLVLLDGAWARLLEIGIVEIVDGDVIVHSADEFLEAFALHQLTHTVAVRSAFSAEDRPDESLAGFFETKLNIKHDDKVALINALIDVWRSGELREGDFRRDILVMEMVNAQVAGVAFTEKAYQDDIVNFTSGTGDKLVSGAVAGETVMLPKLVGSEGATVEAGWQRRLQLLLRGVRRSFNLEGTDWDIEWADDGTQCWLLQIRPITRPPRRNEAFTSANLKEILPDLPSRFMTSIVASSSDGLFNWYRQFDKSLPENRHMVEIFYGRPLFNLTLLTDMMRHWGLPSSLVTNSIGGSAETETGLKLGRFFRKTITLLKLGWWQLNAVRYAKAQTTTILKKAEESGDNFTDVATSFRDLFVLFVSEMLNLTQAMSGPLLVLRRTNTLTAHTANTKVISADMFTQLQQLSTLVDQHPAWHADLETGDVPDNNEFSRAWAQFLAEHGHRGVYESDISRPRYRENSAELLRSLTYPVLKNTQPEKPRSGRGLAFWLTKPLGYQLNRVQAAREEWRYQSMKCYEICRNKLLTLSKAAAERGQLPSAENLWQLTLAEVIELDQGRVFDDTYFATLSAERERLATINLPDFIRRFDDLETAEQASGETVSSWRGVSLTSGEISGKAWVLKEPSTQLPDGFDPEETILVARSVDAGWIPTFGRVAGVVVEIGGDLSHGSIILREIGLPAITNVQFATSQIEQGDPLRLNAGVGRVSRPTT